MTVRLRPEAEADIEGIALFIANDNPVAARNWLADIQLRCQRLGAMPGMGVARFDLRPNLRMFPVGSYLILYQEIGGGVEIVRVLHGARQWQELL
ncbi:MAG: type II toxin-antitoxin system RelE/ParE family toxin [Beijerinckiaceae bacterium]